MVLIHSSASLEKFRYNNAAGGERLVRNGLRSERLAVKTVNINPEGSPYTPPPAPGNVPRQAPPACPLPSGGSRGTGGPAMRPA